jgi:hypothetical protein
MHEVAVHQIASDVLRRASLVSRVDQATTGRTTVARIPGSALIIPNTAWQMTGATVIARRVSGVAAYGERRADDICCRPATDSLRHARQQAPRAPRWVLYDTQLNRNAPETDT